MHVSMLVRRTISLLAVTGLVAACSDAPSELAAPQARTVRFEPTDLQLAAARYGNEARGHSGPDGGVEEATITVDPRQSRTYAFGKNWIYFPDYSICDPATSTYGVGTWDSPCEPLRRPIQIRVRWQPKGGHGYVEFEPELRFVPSSRLHDWVILAIYDRKPLDSEGYRILWETKDPVNDEKIYVDEAASDPTLRAYVDRRDQTVYRRVKHFSGYLVAGGFTDLGGLGGGFGYAY